MRVCFFSSFSLFILYYFFLSSSDVFWSLTERRIASFSVCVALTRVRNAPSWALPTTKTIHWPSILQHRLMKNLENRWNHRHRCNRREPDTKSLHKCRPLSIHRRWIWSARRDHLNLKLPLYFNSSKAADGNAAVSFSLISFTQRRKFLLLLLLHPLLPGNRLIETCTFFRRPFIGTVRIFQPNIDYYLACSIGKAFFEKGESSRRTGEMVGKKQIGTHHSPSSLSSFSTLNAAGLCSRERGRERGKANPCQIACNQHSVGKIQQPFQWQPPPQRLRLRGDTLRHTFMALPLYVAFFSRFYSFLISFSSFSSFWSATSFSLPAEKKKKNDPVFNASLCFFCCSNEIARRFAFVRWNAFFFPALDVSSLISTSALIPVRERMVTIVIRNISLSFVVRNARRSEWIGRITATENCRSSRTLTEEEKRKKGKKKKRFLCFDFF